MTLPLRWMPRALVFIGGLTGSLPAGAAADPSPPSTVLDRLEVTSPRLEAPLATYPGALSTIPGTRVRQGRARLGIGDALAGVPGLFAQNRYNFAQDLRLSLRGFGARASFGVRGIQVWVDGIPLTLPDGQSALDILDPSTVERIEVIRGPASAQYGNAAGGVVAITTTGAPPTPALQGRVTAGSYGLRAGSVQGGGRADPWDLRLGARWLTLDGFRDHSRAENQQFTLRLGRRWGASSDATLWLTHLNAPEAQDPGGLTADEVASDRDRARTRNVTFDAGETVEQTTLGGRLRHRLAGSNGVIEASPYLIHRDFANRLPFTDGGQVEFDRWVVGGSLGYRATYGADDAPRYTVRLGLDGDWQADDRQRFDNEAGDRGARVFDQRERVTAAGLFLQNRLAGPGPWVLRFGARYDRVRFDVEDRFGGDGDDSDAITFTQPSFNVGLTRKLPGEVSVFARVATGFQTPTTTELADPSGSGGFNTDLEPQRAIDYEIGLRSLRLLRSELELVGFWIEVSDELVPFETADNPGRVFFRNAGSSTRRGVEAVVTTRPALGWETQVSYAYLDAIFDTFSTPEGGDLSGNRIPGVPRHQLFGRLRYDHGSGGYAVSELRSIHGLMADDRNQTEIASYRVVDLRAGVEHDNGPWTGRVFVGVNNLAATEYPDNVRVNAFGDRFFEPAPGRNAFGGIQLERRFAGDNR